MQNIWVVAAMLLISALLIWALYQFLKREGAKESMFMQVVLFVPRIITNFFHALTMDEKGYSLRKILTCAAVGVAARVSFMFGTTQNGVLILLIWLIFAGILAGLYNIGEIADAIKTVKSSSNEPTTKPTDTPI